MRPVRAAMALGWCALGFLGASCAPRPAAFRAAAPPVLVVRETPPANPGWAGSAACRGCHPAAWDRWRATRHAESLVSLGEDGREDAACLRCHATGFGEAGGYRRGDPPEQLGAVGCEACHGPSRPHARDPGTGTAAGIERGCPPCVINELCRLCHTEAWSPDFTPAGYFDKVICPPGLPGPATTNPRNPEEEHDGAPRDTHTR